MQNARVGLWGHDWVGLGHIFNKGTPPLANHIKPLWQRFPDPLLD